MRLSFELNPGKRLQAGEKCFKTITDKFPNVSDDIVRFKLLTVLTFNYVKHKKIKLRPENREINTRIQVKKPPPWKTT